MEKVDYNEKERLAWSSYVFLEKEKQKKKTLLATGNIIWRRQRRLLYFYYSYQTVESPLASQKIKKN
jgi:hypothetical protein